MKIYITHHCTPVTPFVMVLRGRVICVREEVIVVRQQTQNLENDPQLFVARPVGRKELAAFFWVLHNHQILWLYKKITMRESVPPPEASHHLVGSSLFDPSPASTDEAVCDGKVLVDYKKKDYRGFVFVVHEEYGLMLLRCARKKMKGPHWQAPGGHVDDPEFVEAGTPLSNEWFLKEECLSLTSVVLSETEQRPFHPTASSLQGWSSA